ncbi:unnamed protein product [Spirodela intermedia]|uniref:Uncharacterized protein n=1 Tax=Spirodela intermedia TaxID=51605 RepID=A0A7I8JQ52_SPIIN|nr:unnamed protein product [Spirodela intermedia]CAA6671562.1 unnamed protein product [Spirodela intermedia]
MEEGGLVRRCIEAAAESAKSVEKWRRQRRTLERLPTQLADALFRLLHHRRLLYPSLLEIFQYCLEEVDFHGENCIDAEWMAYLGGFRYLRALNLAGAEGSTTLFFGMVSLKDLDISRCSKITDAGIEHILSISNLERLCISETRVTSKGIIRLSSLVNLRSLDLGGLPVTDQAIDSLKVLVQLEYLDLWGSEITNEGSLLFTRFPRLAHLNIAWTEVNCLPNLPSLIHLNMSNCSIHSIFQGHGPVKPSLSELLVHGATFADVDQAFSYLNIDHLSVLDLSSSAISDFNFLVRMRSLERLDLSSGLMTDYLITPVASTAFKLRDLNLSNTKITTQSMCILAGKVPNLEKLSLSESMIDDTSLQYLALMPSLRTIDLSKTGIQGCTYAEGDRLAKILSLPVLQNLDSLEILNLEGTRVRDDSLHPLGLLKGLKHLYLKSDFLSDVSFHIMSSLPDLRVLGFQGAVLTNNGLLSFRPPERLQVLDLRGCWLLSKDGISSFCGVFPQIKVKHESVQMLHLDQSQKLGSSKLKPDLTQCEPLGGHHFTDERIKYSREELMELTSSPPSDVLQAPFLSSPWR